MQKRRKLFSVLALAMVLSLVAAACGDDGAQDDDNGTPSPGDTGVTEGGIYRTALEDFGFTGAFDPTGEYLGTAFGLFSQLLLRNLVTYKHVGGAEGDDIVPDLAEIPEPSEDGLTWEFTLKDGVMFGPPLSREITSADVEFAFRRIAHEPLVAQYGFYYYGVIEGLDAASPEMPDDITGIETPDDKTVIFRLTAPTGDFLYRLAMPAAAPMPEEVAGCYDTAGDYGRNLVASGPYMIQGSDEVDASSCDTIEPISGFDPTKFMKIVRNPDYDPATDDPETRGAHLDGISIEINSNTDDIFAKVETGDYDGTMGSQPPKEVEQRYLTDPELQDRMHADPGDRTWYVTMNMLVPPFDDVNVRKAVNQVINKEALQKAWGGPVHGDIATHIMPPTVLDFGGEEYDPYPSPNNAGDVDAAKEFMSQSKYDTDGDGVCDADVCNDILFINRTTPPHADMSPPLTQNFAEMGLNVKLRELDTGTAYTTIQTVKNLVPIAANAGWGKDYPDPSTFAVLFHSSGISCEGQINYSELGMTAEQAEECGVAEQFNALESPPPSVDEEIDACNELLEEERTQCWVDLDKMLMEEVVPWAPYLWGNALTIVGESVTNYEFDQFSGIISLVHISVNNGLTEADI